MVFELRWGIIATGKISTVVTKERDLTFDFKTRDVHDIVHKVIDVSSRSIDSAQQFIDAIASGDNISKAYGSYDGVFADPTERSRSIHRHATQHPLIKRIGLKLNAPLASSMPGVTIRCEKGTINIPAPICCPKSYKVAYMDKSEKVKKEEGKEFSYIGGGWHWQADEVAGCVKEGKRESGLWGWGKSVFEMGVFDEVRKQGGLVYPPGVEKVGRVE